MPSVRLLIGLLIVSGLGNVANAADELNWLPGSINGLAAVRVAEIYASPLAKRENWAKTAAQNFVNQQALLPPGTELLLCGSEFGISANLPALKEYAIVKFARPVSLQILSDLGAGDLETIEGHQTMSLAQGGFVLEESDKLWRFVAPGGRQAGMKWLRQRPTADSQLSPFLQTAFDAVKHAAHVFVALDLSDALTPNLLSPVVSEMESLEKLNPQSRVRVIEALAGLRGAALKVNVTEDLQAELRLTFNEPPTALAPVAQPLLRDVLGYLGASLESAATWTSASSADSLVFRGSITAAEVRRILSLFRGHDVADAGSTQVAVAGQAAAAPTAEQVALATKKYFQEVDGLIEDLRGTLSKNRDNHALWFERYGRKIDDLSMLNVDPDLLTFGQRVSSSFRYQGQALRTAKVRGGVRVAQSGANNVYRSTTAYVGPYGGTYWETNTGTIANAAGIKAEERATAKDVQFSEWKQIEDGLVSIRRTLTERYRINF